MRFLKNIFKNGKYSNLGLSMLLIGLTLWADKRFFIWPPQFQPQLNDNGLDAIAVVLGVCLFVYAGLDAHNNRVAGLLLGLSVGFVVIITGLEIAHVMQVGLYRLNLSAILGIYLIINVMIDARHRNTKR